MVVAVGVSGACRSDKRSEGRRVGKKGGQKCGNWKVSEI